MKTARRNCLIAFVFVSVATFAVAIARAADPLPSWNDGKARQSIVDFVGRLTLVTPDGNKTDFKGGPEVINFDQIKITVEKP